jgi:hypothetical protein
MIVTIVHEKQNPVLQMQDRVSRKCRPGLPCKCRTLHLVTVPQMQDISEGGACPANAGQILDKPLGWCVGGASFEREKDDAAQRKGERVMAKEHDRKSYERQTEPTAISVRALRDYEEFIGAKKHLVLGLLSHTGPERSNSVAIG